MFHSLLWCCSDDIPMIWLCTKVNFVYSSRAKNQGMTQGNKTSYTTWWLMLILWHMWNIQPGSTRAFGAMETSRYCEGIDCFHISKCPARANFQFRHVIPVLIKYWYKFTENLLLVGFISHASFVLFAKWCILSRFFSHFRFLRLQWPVNRPVWRRFLTNKHPPVEDMSPKHIKSKKLCENGSYKQKKRPKKTRKDVYIVRYSIEVCICICTTAESSESSSCRRLVPKTFSSKSRLYASTPWFRNVRLFCKWYPSSNTNVGTVRCGNEFHQQRHPLFP